MEGSEVILPNVPNSKPSKRSRKMKTNIQLLKLVEELKKQASVENVKVWKRLALDLEKPTRQRRIVNIYKINKFTKPEETVVVPGKVLSVGELSHKVNVAAFNFSEGAKQKIVNSQGKVMTIYELMKSNPKGKGVRIMG